MSPPHPYANSLFLHPVNLIFLALKELDLGFKLPSSLSADNGMGELYAVHCISFVYYVLCDYFGNEGALTVTGAAAMRQIQANPDNKARYKIVREIVTSEYNEFFRCATQKKNNAVLVAYLKMAGIIATDVTAGSIVQAEDTISSDDEDNEPVSVLVPIGLHLLFLYLPLLYE